MIILKKYYPIPNILKYFKDSQEIQKKKNLQKITCFKMYTFEKSFRFKCHTKKYC